MSNKKVQALSGISSKAATQHDLPFLYYVVTNRYLSIKPEVTNHKALDHSGT